MRLAIVGATGEVGRMLLKCLKEFDIKFDTLDLYASMQSEGKMLSIENNSYVVRGLTSDALKQSYDYVFFTAGSNISKEYAHIATEQGATVIDNSSAFRQENTIPLVVPEVNGDILKSYKGIVANPNCSTIQLVLFLHPLNEYKKIKKVVVTTMQSVSGTGNSGIMELQNQKNGSMQQKVYPRPIYMNVIPQIGEIVSTGDLYKINFCQEELKMTFETRKILNISDLNLVATTVRVPVVYGHSESVYIEFDEKVSLKEVTHILSNNRSIIHDDKYITPLEIGDSDMSHVSRIRYAGDEKSILLWNVANNVRLGAATNAVKIMIFHNQINNTLQNLAVQSNGFERILS